MQLLKLVVGIDVASDSLEVASGTIDLQQSITITRLGGFKNTVAGFQQLHKAIARQRTAVLTEAGIAEDQLPLWIVMEASGVYYERLAVWLVEHGYNVTVVLPNNIKAHARSDNRKSKTDRIDAEVITRYGLEKCLKPWHPASALMTELKGLVREHETNIDELGQVHNRLHALETASAAPKKTVKRLRQQRDLLKKQLKQIEQEIKELVKSDPELSESVKYLDSAPGVGLYTAAVVLAETNSFALVEQADQLTSYAGIDPVLRESGKYKGKVTISHKGNRMLRRALYMPALAAIRKDPAMRELYTRVVSRTSQKMKGVVAVMRKLLSLMYTLWKKRECFDPAYRNAIATV
jgi:transposase